MTTQMNILERDPIKFIVRDTALTAKELADSAQKIKRPPPLVDSFHKGFRVEGQPPGALEVAKLECEIKCRRFEDDRKQGKSNGKAPKTWDEAFWRNNYKKRPVRAKPYELLEAAQVCADMAEKAGWLNVEVREVKREVRAAIAVRDGSDDTHTSIPMRAQIKVRTV